MKARLDALRARFDAHDIDGYLVPRGDAFGGEYVRAGDERLAWISGFTGSAGHALITREHAYLFVDGRYTLAAAKQAPDFEIIDWPMRDVRDLFEGRLGVDPWLVSAARMSALDAVRTPNLIDEIWDARPPYAPIALTELPLELAGVTTEDKLAALRAALGNAGVDAFLSTSPEGAAWLLNARGGEIPTVPAPHIVTLVSADRLRFYGMTAPGFTRPAEFLPLSRLSADIGVFDGVIGFDDLTLPAALAEAIKCPKPITDPIIAAKAIKNPAEIAASHGAHARDARAMIRFLHWLDDVDPLVVDEIKAADRLADFRIADPDYIGASFETISGFGPNGAIVHYRVDRDSNLPFGDGIYLIDSGGHYPGATTDITRTVWIGRGDVAAKTPFTEVLIGLAAISRAQFPIGTSGREIDALARAALWQSGRDYAHGTGHGVGAGLSVHEGPQGISRRNSTPLAPGMIVSLEPGYYRAGAFGIRLENLALVVQGDPGYLRFETLSYVPFDTRLIDPARLDAQTRSWLNAYHHECRARHAALLDAPAREWLERATNAMNA